jgi:hypothetical protein
MPCQFIVTLCPVRIQCFGAQATPIIPIIWHTSALATWDSESCIFRIPCEKRANRWNVAIWNTRKKAYFFVIYDCICICLCPCLCIYMYIYIYTFTCTCTCVHVYVYKDMYVDLYMYIMYRYPLSASILVGLVQFGTSASILLAPSAI